MTGQPVTGDADLAARLARLDTCTLSDALDVLGMEGVISGLVPLWEGARLAGPAVTVKLAPDSPEAGQSRVHLVRNGAQERQRRLAEGRFRGAGPGARGLWPYAWDGPYVGQAGDVTRVPMAAGARRILTKM